jgi:exopolysaccharide biosynthesis polyprenyl glycosylphosphotransferase
MLRRDANYIIISFLLDLIFALIAVFIANWLRIILPFGLPLHPNRDLGILLLIVGILYPIIFIIFSVYDPNHTYRAVDEYQRLSIVCMVAALALAGFVYFTIRDVSRLTLLYFFATHLTLVVLWRAVIRIIRRSLNIKGQDLRNVLLIGGGEIAQRALEHLDELAWAGVHLVGYLTDGNPIPSNNCPRLGKLSDIESVMQEQDVQDVLIALPAESYTKVNDLIIHLIDKPSNVWIVPDYFSLLIYGGHVEDLGDVPMISLKAPKLTGYQRVAKRAFDLVIGMILQLAILPFMAVIAVAIRIDSPGPIIFKQQRVGENGRLFLMYKFRSMYDGADTHLKDVIRFDQDGNLIHKRPDDPRVTRVGRFLRKFSLDELPQFMNVLKGDMSLVGPRPELPILVEKYEPWQRARFAVPQGITGWWQVNGRSDKPMHLNTEDDLYYVRNYSLLLDFQIIIKTALVVLRGKGAY